MTPRRRSRALAPLVARPALRGRDLEVASAPLDVSSWAEPVRLHPERAAGTTAAARQHQVRFALFERCQSLAADYFSGPHRRRPEVARRLVAHFDALAVAGTNPDVVASFVDELDLEDEGAAWLMTLLLSCLGGERASELLEAWLSTLDPAGDPGLPFAVAEALALRSNEQVDGVARGWLRSPHPILATVALELRGAGALTPDEVGVLARLTSPLVWVALERTIARSSEPERLAVARVLPHRPTTWHDPQLGRALAWEMARARLLQGDNEPLALIRLGDPAVVEILGCRVLDVLAMAGDDLDGELARDLSLAFETTPGVLDAIGRAGYACLFPRLLAALATEHEDGAHHALTTALGALVERPNVAAWSAAVSLAAQRSEASSGRMRAGRPYRPGAVIDDLRRDDLSALAVGPRLDELVVLAGRPRPADSPSFDTTLDSSIGAASMLFSAHVRR